MGRWGEGGLVPGGEERRVTGAVPLGKLGRCLGDRPLTGNLGEEVKASLGNGRGLRAGVPRGKKGGGSVSPKKREVEKTEWL